MSLGFYVDLSSCICCRTCQVACKDKNNLEVGVILRNAKTYELGTYPDVQVFNYSASCNHCENPACVTACPTGAMYKAEDGTVIHDKEVCIGCQSCVSACPYSVPQYNAAQSIVNKCDACAYLRAKGMNPACVDACPNRALDFGDLDELRAKYGSDLVSDLSILPASSATGPNLLIKAKECAKSGETKELPL